MSVRPTLVSLGFGILFTGLFAVAVLCSSCRVAKSGGEAAASPTLQTALARAGNAAQSVLKPTAAGGNQPAAASAAAQATAEKKPYVWQVIRLDGKIKLRGQVPSEDDRRTILGMVKAHFPDLDIDDGLHIAAGAPPKEQWLGAVSFALKELDHIDHGNAKLSDVALSLTGVAKSSKDYDQLQHSLSGALPTGLSLQDDSVQPPLADPYVFSAALETPMLVLSGNVPDEALHKRVRALAQELFPGATVTDKLTLASGAPGKWDNAVTAAMHALGMLDKGQVSLSGSTLTITGMAPDKDSASQVDTELKHDLPAAFTTSKSIKWKEAGVDQDVAKKIIPRIKEIVDTKGLALERALPSWNPDASP